MSSGFVSIDPLLLDENVFHLIGKEWFLISAGTSDDYNMMTASWGGMGILWNKPVVYIVVRPTRYTYEFLEKSENFALNFFNKEYKKTLNLLGSKSGRDIDKMMIEELNIQEGLMGGVFFKQARLVMECKKLYFSDLTATNFIDPALDAHYPLKDYHRLYVGEILNTLKKNY